MGYEFETVSEEGATVRVKGMFSERKLYWSNYTSDEMRFHEHGGMKWHAAMFADPHDWLWLHVDPPEQGVLWGSETVFQLVTALGETLYGGPILLTDSPMELRLYSARDRSVLLNSEAEYGRNRLGYICVAVGFPKGGLRADHGDYWAVFETPRSFVVLEGGRDVAKVEHLTDR